MTLSINYFLERSFWSRTLNSSDFPDFSIPESYEIAEEPSEQAIEQTETFLIKIIKGEDVKGIILERIGY